MFFVYTTFSVFIPVNLSRSCCLSTLWDSFSVKMKHKKPNTLGSTLPKKRNKMYRKWTYTVAKRPLERIYGEIIIIINEYFEESVGEKHDVGIRVVGCKFLLQGWIGWKRIITLKDFYCFTYWITSEVSQPEVISASTWFAILEHMSLSCWEMFQ